MFKSSTNWLLYVPMFQANPQFHADSSQEGKATNERENEVAERQICNQEKSWALGFTSNMDDDTENEDDRIE